MEEITHQLHPVSSTSPPVRDTNNSSLVVLDDARSSTTTTSSSSTTVASPAVKPTAFAVEFGPETEKLTEDTTGLSINDSLSKFLPERLRVKQQQQQEEKARSREALARELKQQQQMATKKGTPTRTSVKAQTTGSSTSKSATTPKLQQKSTGSTGSGKKQPEQYTEHSLYKEAAEFDRKLAVDNSGISPASYSDATEMIVDDNADKASECGTYTIALDDSANGANSNNDRQQQRKNSDDEPQSGQYPWQSVLDKFLASSTGANASGKFDDDATASGSRSTSSSTTDGINNVNSGGANDISKLEAEIDQLAEERAMNISLQDVKNFPQQQQPARYEGALSNGSSNGTPQPKTVAPKATPLPSHHQQPVAQTTTVRQQPNSSAQKTFMSPPVSKGSEQKHRTIAAQFHMPPAPSQSKSQGPQVSRRPYSTGVNVASSRYSPSMSTAVRSSTIKSQTSESSLTNDSINTELLLQDTEKVVKTLTNRQAALERQQKLSPSIRQSQPEPHLSPRNAPERRSERVSSQRRQQISKIGSPSKRASSTSRNPSVGSNLDSAGSSSDVCGPARDRLYLRMTASSAARQSSAQQLRRERETNASVGSSSVISAATEPRVQSRQSLGQRIVLKSRDNAKLEQYRGAAAVSSIQQARSRQKAQAKLTAQEEQRARELEAWRRRKGYDPRKSVAEERAAKRSSRNSSLSRNSVESTEDSEYRVALLNNQHSSRNQPRYENQHHQQLDDDNEQPREISLDDYPDDDEFILVYDDGEHDEDTIDSVTEVTPAPTSLPPAISSAATPATSYSQSPQLQRSTKLNSSRDQSLVDSVATSCFESGSDTPRAGNKQYQQLKDGTFVINE